MFSPHISGCIPASILFGRWSVDNRRLSTKYRNMRGIRDYDPSRQRTGLVKNVNKLTGSVIYFICHTRGTVVTSNKYYTINSIAVPLRPAQYSHIYTWLQSALALSCTVYYRITSIQLVTGITVFRACDRPGSCLNGISVDRLI